MKIGLYLDTVSMHILNKGLFVSCEPVDNIEKHQPGLVDERLSEVGNYYLVCDMQKEIQGKAKLVDAFITTFGDPDPIILGHMGFKDNVEKFKTEYAGLFKSQFPDDSLIEETELFVCVYEAVHDS
jgi:uncharacterized protein YhfF